MFFVQVGMVLVRKFNIMLLLVCLLFCVIRRFLMEIRN